MGELKQVPGDEGAGRRRLLTPRHALVVGQVAVSLALLTAGGLFARSASEAARADPGFRLEGGLIASLAGYDAARGREIYHRVLERVRALPGVGAASLACQVPFGDFTFDDRVRRLDVDAEAGGTRAISTVAVSRLIYQATPYDPAVFGGGVAVLCLAALAATWPPALRAARIDPYAALRTD